MGEGTVSRTNNHHGEAIIAITVVAVVGCVISYFWGNSLSQDEKDALNY